MKQYCQSNGRVKPEPEKPKRPRRSKPATSNNLRELAALLCDAPPHNDLEIGWIQDRSGAWVPIDELAVA